jgi:hypothetical protein
MITRSAWRTPSCAAVAAILSIMPFVRSPNFAVEVAYVGAGPTLVMLVFASTNTVRVTGEVLPGGCPCIVTVLAPRAVTVPMRPIGTLSLATSGGIGWCPIGAAVWKCKACGHFHMTADAPSKITRQNISIRGSVNVCFIFFYLVPCSTRKIGYRARKVPLCRCFEGIDVGG